MIRQLAIEGGARLGVFRLMRSVRRRAISVLSYHGFVDDEQRTRGRFSYLYRNSLSVRRFDQQLTFLRRAGHLLHPDEFLEILDGQGTPSRRTPGMLITIDDANRSVFDLALPVLVARVVPAVLLVPTEGVAQSSSGQPWCQWHERLAVLLVSDPATHQRTWTVLREFLPTLPAEPLPYTHTVLAEVERAAWTLPDAARQELLERVHAVAGRTPDPAALRYADGSGTVLDVMTWDQLRAARDSGVEIGSHTVSHAKLARLSEPDLCHEIVESARAIRAHLGAPCRFFSMPYDQAADCHPQQERVLEEAGYQAAFFQEQAPEGPPSRFRVSRIGIPPQCSLARLDFYLSGARDVVRRIRLPERGLAAGAAWMLGAQGVRLLAQLVYFLLLARRLGAEGYGAFAAALGAVSLAVPFAAMGAGSFLIRGVTRGVETPDYWWGRAVLTVVRGGTSLALVVMGIGWLMLHGRIPFWLLLGVTMSDVVLLPLIEVSGQAFQALGRLDRTALTWVVWSVLKVAAAVTLTVVPGGSLRLWAMLYPLSTGGAALAAVVAVTRRVGWPPRPASFGRAELREGLMFSLSGSARSIYDDIDKAMLARFDTLGVTGIYGAAYRIIDVAFLPIRSLVFAAYPRFFARGASGVRSAAAFARGLVPAAAAYGMVAGAALVALAPLVPLVLGHSYAGVASAIRWLAVLPLLRAMHYFAADALTGAGHQELRTAAQIGVAVLNIALNLVLIPAYSWRGAAWASIASDGTLAVGLWIILAGLSRRSADPAQAPGIVLVPEQTGR
ncbi:MAG TPA: oligosaccharide flippase family protein [Gemmatimonadales bacterium]|nr:oligosaccharide flippase family protein [Gemmatimonadales bacterium]